jgi:hypothetical protein
MAAGYSGTPLAQKLGIKSGHRVALLAAPRGFEKTLGTLPEDVAVTAALSGKASFDVVVLFVTSKKDLEARFDVVVARLDPAGGFWVGWPKKASGVVTDMTEDVVRKMALAAGLVDNKVCAIDETWSGLRVVIRVKNRPKR